MLILTRYRWAWASAVVAGVLCVATMLSTKSWGEQATAQGYANPSLLISGQELASQLAQSSLRLLDARRPEQYAVGHIPGAVNLPLAAITRTVDGVPEMLAPHAELEEALGQRGVAREAQVVIYDEFGGIQAARLFWAFHYLGHPRVSVLNGGFALWQREGQPISREVARSEATRYRGESRPDRVATRAWVLVHLQDPSVVLVDARSPEEFTGAVPGQDIKRPGHIPGAANMDWVRNLTQAEPRQFKAGAELAQLYQEAGMSPEKEIVVYCRTGVRASHAYFVLRLLGYPRVRLYDGSYLEWAADPTLPVAR